VRRPRRRLEFACWKCAKKLSAAVPQEFHRPRPRTHKNARSVG
jgi:hypothetical protein